ncbi:MAG: DUF190 domain-containing protein [Sulfuricurvum sp.]|uniref:DUF190 domain-containing protein n=1 Tax=Sulfuricurvum sp. TaxID=2025608 RepID=UPI0025DFBD8C|nr:DUF190 domain-containing protein [Sulfuricurvum sp.]MBV5320890.1 DUF190 domain-containing protein [Sulfuricurvum sp.]
MKTGYQLTFFTLQSRRHNGTNIVEWLEDVAQRSGISGLTVTNASKGLGHDGRWHSATFFELSDQPLEIMMIADEESCNTLFSLLEEQKSSLFYTKTAIEYGII